jgi:hypothetical protein
LAAIYVAEIIFLGQGDAFANPPAGSGDGVTEVFVDGAPPSLVATCRSSIPTLQLSTMVSPTPGDERDFFLK